VSICSNIFYASASASLLVLVAGTVASPIAGCSTTFCLSPALNLGVRVLGYADGSQPISQPPSSESEKNPRPIDEPFNPITTPDSRLSVCPEGSLEPTIPEISATVARNLKTQIENGATFNSLLELQGAINSLGPHCNFRNGDSIIWRFLIRGGGAIQAIENAGEIKVDFVD